jgi:hypothetical protein
MLNWFLRLYQLKLAQMTWSRPQIADFNSLEQWFYCLFHHLLPFCSSKVLQDLFTFIEWLRHWYWNLSFHFTVSFEFYLGGYLFSIPFWSCLYLNFQDLVVNPHFSNSTHLWAFATSQFATVMMIAARIDS